MHPAEPDTPFNGRPALSYSARFSILAGKPSQMIHARLPAFNGEFLRHRNYVTACGILNDGVLVVVDPVQLVQHKGSGVAMPASHYCIACERVLRVLVLQLLAPARDIAAGRIPAPIK